LTVSISRLRQYQVLVATQFQGGLTNNCGLVVLVLVPVATQFQGGLTAELDRCDYDWVPVATQFQGGLTKVHH